LHTLEDLGWSPHFESQLAGRDPDGLFPARIAEELKGAYRIYVDGRLLPAVLPGKMLHTAAGRDDLPATGDWVLARPLPGEDRALVVELLERRTKLSRKEAGERTGEQLLAANVDLVFLVASLNRELNLRRIERYLTAIWESGAQPVIALNKADLAEEAAALFLEVEAIAPGVPVHVTSAATGEGVDELAAHLGPGLTAVFVGSSGVGKSSLINCIIGTEAQTVAGIREDGKGRHTTTSRQMLVLPGRGVIIDTPGLRELQLWTNESGASMAFSDVETFAGDCRFSDCTHEREPGCAVRAALEADRLDEDRVRSYRKLERERIYIARKHDQALQLEEKKRWKQIHKDNRQRMRIRGR